MTSILEQLQIRLSHISLAVMLTRSIYVVSLAAAVLAHEEHHDQTPIQGPHEGLWYKPYENRIPGDGGTQVSQLT